MRIFEDIIDRVDNGETEEESAAQNIESIRAGRPDFSQSMTPYEWMQSVATGDYQLLAVANLFLDDSQNMISAATETYELIENVLDLIIGEDMWSMQVTSDEDSYMLKKEGIVYEPESLNIEYPPRKIDSEDKTIIRFKIALSFAEEPEKRIRQLYNVIYKIVSYLHRINNDKVMHHYIQMFIYDKDKNKFLWPKYFSPNEFVALLIYNTMAHNENYNSGLETLTRLGFCPQLQNIGEYEKIVLDMLSERKTPNVVATAGE